MPDPLKVLFLFEDLIYGGTQKQNLALAKGLDRARFAPEILTLTGATDLDGQAGDIPIHHIGRRRNVPPFFFCQLAPTLRRLRPDILVPCTALPNIWGRIWGRLLGVPVIVGTCRGGGAPARQHEQLLWRLADHIVCNSPHLIPLMEGRGVPASRLSVIANGVDTTLFSPPGQPVPNQVILCVARLAGDKDHATLLRAFEIVGAQLPGSRLRVVGEGPEEHRLKEQAAMLPSSISSRIEFCGPAANTAPYYQQAQVFALSSIREAQPNVILEAMSAGLPVCATAVGDIPRLIQEGQNGFLSAPGDAQALAANLIILLTQPGNGQEMGRRNREKIARYFSFKTMIDAHQNLFCRLAENRQVSFRGGK